MSKKDEFITTQITFKIRNVPASLNKAIGGFATSGVNILQLTTEPDPNSEGFPTAVTVFAEIEGRPDDPHVQLGLEELSFFTQELTVKRVGSTTERSSSSRFVEVRRDHFDILRELDALLAELTDHFRKINDPKIVTKDIRYVRASAEAMREFIATYEEADEVEVPVQLPRSLLERLRSLSISKVDGIAGTVQRIADIISKLFL